MIQLATEPTASRLTYRPAQGEGEAKAQAFETPRTRSGHAWPFLSRPVERPVRPDSARPTSSDGS